MLILSAFKIHESRQMRHFLDIADIEASELRAILDEAHRCKKARINKPKGALDEDAPLSGHILAQLFEKSSTRTRFSFEVAMQQLGGKSITTSSNDMQLGRGESIEDTARVLSRFVDLIMLRANSHKDLLTLANHASVPVINGLTDYNHPCQIMADLMSLEEKGRVLKDLRLCWVGDGNNVARSFVNAAAKFGYDLVVSTPKNYNLSKAEIDRAIAHGAKITLVQEPKKAVLGADVVIADTWVSMGDKNADKRIDDLSDWQVNEDLMARAKPDALFMHCLPAHRGEEVTEAVIDGAQSIIFDEAENRLHAQKAIIKWCLNV